MDTAFSRGDAGCGAHSPGWALRRKGLAASADSGTFPGLASGPSCSLKTAVPLGWQPCGRPLTLPGMTPCLCVALGGVAGLRRGSWAGGHPPTPSWTNLVVSQLTPDSSSLGAEPGWLQGPRPLLLLFPLLRTPSLSLSLLAPFRVLFDMPLVQRILVERVLRARNCARINFLCAAFSMMSSTCNGEQPSSPRSDLWLPLLRG